MIEENELKVCTNVLNSITGSTLNIARILTYIDENKLYLLGDCKNTAEYAKREFSYSKSTVSKLINICKKFGSQKGYNKDSRTGILMFDSLIKENSTGFYSLDDQYKKYGYSKLYIMMNLDDKHLKMCSPDLSVKQINDIYLNQKKLQKLKDKKQIEDEFEIKADKDDWYKSKNVTSLFKVSRLQIRAPDDDIFSEWLNEFFKDKKKDYSDDEQISIFSVLAMRHYMNHLIEERKKK